jgi:dTMP kinase
MKNKKGKFIILEGIDACGKDTQEKLLKEKFPDFIFFHVLDENNLYTNTLRNAMFNPDYRWQAFPEMLLFWADKFEIAYKIKKLIAEGKNVTMNRWEISNLAYQIYGKEKWEYEKFAREMLQKLDEIVKPDLYIYFEITAEESLKRRQIRMGENYKRDDYYESEKKDFFDKVINGYKIEVGKYNHVMIDGMQTKEKVFNDIKIEVENILK